MLPGAACLDGTVANAGGVYSNRPPLAGEDNDWNHPSTSTSPVAVAVTPLLTPEWNRGGVVHLGAA
jgi:hypothetical protein